MVKNNAVSRAALPVVSRKSSGALLVLTVISFFTLLEATSPNYFLWDDNASANLPSFVYNWRALTETGQLPHINLHQYAGQIWLGNGQSGVLYPPIYLAAAFSELLLGDLRHTMDVLAIMHLALGALAMLLLLRDLEVDPTVAWLSGLLWSTFPFLAQVSRNWIFVSFVAALIPLNLWLLERLIRKPSFRAAFALGVCKALLFYQGHVNYAVMTAVFDGVFLLVGFVLRRERRAVAPRVVLAYAQALLISGALAAPLLLPMLQAQQMSAYRSSRMPLADFLSISTPIVAFVKAQVGMMQPRAIHLASGSLFYFGIPCLLLLAAALLSPLLRRRQDDSQPSSPSGRLRLTPLVPAVAALIAFMLSTRGMIVLYPLPVISSFRWPFKYFLFFLLFATVAMALSGSLLESRFGQAGRRFFLGALALAIAGNVAVLLIWDQPFGPSRIDRDIEDITADAQRALPDSNNPDTDPGRVLSLWQKNGQPQSDRHLTHNYASLVGAYHLGGYDPLIAADNLELALGLEYANVFRYQLDERTLQYLSHWGVRHFVAPIAPRFDAELDRWPQLRPYYRDDVLQVRENTLAQPLASMRETPMTPEKVRWSPNGVDVAPSRSGVLRLALAPLPWWFARTADGQSLDVRVTADKQLEIDVPEGVELVTLRYRNIPFRLGAGVALAFLLSAGALSWRRRHPKLLKT